MGGIGDFLFGSKAKSKQNSSSSSGNYAYDDILNSFGGTMNNTSAGSSMIGSLLGIPQQSFSNVPYNGGTGGGGSSGGGIPQVVGGGGPLGSWLQNKLNELGTNGIGGDATPAPSTGGGTGTAPNAASALESFANSAGMNFIRDQGVKAIEGSRAGRGMLQSGATGTELMKFGDNLGRTYLDKYLGHLDNYARLGLGAGGLVAGAGAWSKSKGSGSSTGAKTGLIPMMVAAAASQGAGGMGG